MIPTSFLEAESSWLSWILVMPITSPCGKVTGYADWLKSFKAASGAEDGVSPSQHTLIRMNESRVMFKTNFGKLFQVENAIMLKEKKINRCLLQNLMTY